MAENVSREVNESRFTEYPYDLKRDWWCDLQKRKMIAMCSRILPGEIVYDIGCNSGYIVEFLPAGCVAHGCDLSPELVAKASGVMASAVVAGAENLPWADKSCDVAFLAGVIEYPFDPQLALREAARVARKTVLVEACHEDGVWGRHRIAQHAHMVRSYDEAALIAEVSTIGRVSWLHVVEGRHGDGRLTGQHRIVEITL